jgi:hypothetical protein
MPRPDQPAEDAAEESSDSAVPELMEEDFYYEGPYLVFTAAYHRRRGFCCGSDCRHCPYR